jgi:L-threonylcarbamoyladenylate synthase
MKTRIISIDEKNAIKISRKIFQHGGIIAFPTDTVYGLGALVDDSMAIQRLFMVKGRTFNKAIAVLVGSMDQLANLTPNFNKSAKKLADRFWPGGLTLIVEKSPNLPSILSPSRTIGIRMPDSEFTKELLMINGPLATTSANVSGGKNPTNAQEVLNQLGGKIDLLLDSGTILFGTPSTVVDCTGKKHSIIREGVISAEEIEKALS